MIVANDATKKLWSELLNQRIEYAMTYIEVGDDGILCDLAGGWCEGGAEGMSGPTLLGLTVVWADEVEADDGTANLFELV